VVEPLPAAVASEADEADGEEPDLEARIEEEVSVETRKEELQADSMTSAPPSAAAVRELFAGVEIRRRVDGGIAIEARPESAQTLLSLFEGMAGLLRQAVAG
jgi:hypothetical protein